ncbi:hypothetical protein HAX54_000286 [Datura stramonium]|uniref:DUF4283 domain-containing protein n=1 Tax=Datura stramonium TaxID=4076 RepID=A0ABS8T0T1_DATST|nr:hypothetical protein [Datura stramonium]
MQKIGGEFVNFGTKVVQLQEEDIADATDKWEKAVMLYVVGTKPTIAALERFIAAQWNFAAKTKVYYHNDRYFLVLLAESIKTASLQKDNWQEIRGKSANKNQLSRFKDEDIIIANGFNALLIGHQGPVELGQHGDQDGDDDADPALTLANPM